MVYRKETPVFINFHLNWISITPQRNYHMHDL